jgi:P27 family predicted phage terminase small subunit
MSEGVAVGSLRNRASVPRGWCSLKRIGLLTRIDRAVLAAYCQSYGRWVDAERKLTDTPPLLKTPAGYVQQSPWLTIANKERELMAKFMAELGLTPSSRSRLAVQVPTGPKPWEFEAGKEFFT